MVISHQAACPLLGYIHRTHAQHGQARAQLFAARSPTSTHSSRGTIAYRTKLFWSRNASAGMLCLCSSIINASMCARRSPYSRVA